MAKIIKLESVSIFCVVIISLVSMTRCDPLTVAASTSGFILDLIHRDSPQSPSYDPSLSPSQRIANSLRRSFIRMRRFNANPSSIQSPESDIINAGGEYLMKYSIGTPPVSSLGIADTGSDLIWTQCQPCLKCFNQSLPIFQPKGSSTYRAIPCNSINCKSLQASLCSRDRINCLYSETYGDGSSSQGQLAIDTFTLASTAGKMLSIPSITFGCGYRNDIVFDGGESGIIGLGGGKASLIRQLGPSAQGKFSYCLAPFSDNPNSGKLNFGANAVVSGRGTVSTPLVNKSPDTFYYLTLEGISVGNQRLEFYDPLLSDSGLRQEGNIIIDSGTTLTMLPADLYAKFEKAIKSSIKLKQIKDPAGVLNLCYFLRKDDIQIPDVTVHFQGADLKLRQENILVRTSDDSLCLAAKPVQNLAVYGNLAQTNFFVGYDLENRTVSFKPIDCGKQ